MAAPSAPTIGPRLRELDVPTFVCTGSEDPWSNETVTAEIIDHLRDPELLVVKGASHLPNLEAEDVFTPKLVEFLARQHQAERLSPGWRWEDCPITLRGRRVPDLVSVGGEDP